MTLPLPRATTESMRNYRGFLPLAYATAATLLVAASAWRVHADRTLAAADAALLVAQAAQSPAAASPATAPKPDFTAGLPDDAAIEPMLHSLHQRAAELRLAVTAVNSSAVAPTESTLGRQGLNLTVRGPYLGVHRLLAGLAEGETAAAVLQRLRVQRHPGPGGDVEAQIDLVVPFGAARAPVQPVQEGRAR